MDNGVTLTAGKGQLRVPLSSGLGLRALPGKGPIKQQNSLSLLRACDLAQSFEEPWAHCFADHSSLSSYLLSNQHVGFAFVNLPPTACSQGHTFFGTLISAIKAFVAPVEPKVACWDARISTVALSVSTVLLLIIPLVGVLCSSPKAISSSMGMSSSQGRNKAFSTCGSLSLVSLFSPRPGCLLKF